MDKDRKHGVDIQLVILSASRHVRVLKSKVMKTKILHSNQSEHDMSEHDRCPVFIYDARSRHFLLLPAAQTDEVVCSLFTFGLDEHTRGSQSRQTRAVVMYYLDTQMLLGHCFMFGNQQGGSSDVVLL